MLEEETSRPEELPLAAFAVASELEWQQQQLELESKLLQHQASDHHIAPQAPPPWPELVVQGHGTDQRATGQTPRSKRMEWDGSVAGHCSEITHSLALFMWITHSRD